MLSPTIGHALTSRTSERFPSSKSRAILHRTRVMNGNQPASQGEIGGQAECDVGCAGDLMQPARTLILYGRGHFCSVSGLCLAMLE